MIRGWLSLTCLVTVVLCGVIEQAKEDRVVRHVALEETLDDCVLEGDDVPENTLLDVNETFKNGRRKFGSAKRKRCPR